MRIWRLISRPGLSEGPRWQRAAPAGVSPDDRALGAEFEVIENMSVRAEWEQYGEDCNFYSLGLLYNF